MTIWIIDCALMRMLRLTRLSWWSCSYVGLVQPVGLVQFMPFLHAVKLLLTNILKLYRTWRNCRQITLVTYEYIWRDWSCTWDHTVNGENFLTVGMWWLRGLNTDTYINVYKYKIMDSVILIWRGKLQTLLPLWRVAQQIFV